MARTPTVYRWDDVGAPDINTLMPTTNDKKRLWMHTVLKACLVTGYGSKDAAGWAMPHEEVASNGCRFVLQNAANSGSLLYEGGIFSGGATAMGAQTLWVCSAVPSMDAPVNAWSAETEYSKRNDGSAIHKVSSSCQYWAKWMVVANENTVILICGANGGPDFDLNSASQPAPSQAFRLCFGAMLDGLNLGGVAAPLAGNFYITHGVYSSGYNVERSNYSVHDRGMTCGADMVGLAKQDSHISSLLKVTQVLTYSKLTAWLPMPFVYYQYGVSGPEGSSSYHKSHAVTVVGLKKLDLAPYTGSYLKDFMNDRGWDYGVPFTLGGSQWLVVKSAHFVLDVICLDAAEWGG